MSYKEVLEQTSEVIHEELPANSQVTQIEFEGPEVAVYSKNPKVLVDDETIVKELAKKLRKRIVIRSDPSVRLPKDETIFLINELVGEEGEITSIDFDELVGEVIIEALKPGVIIGKSGEMLRTIISKTLWRPRVMRTPPIESRVIKTIRHLYQEYSKERQEVLRNVGKRIHRPVIFRDDTIRVTALGGFAEVGRSSALIQTGESRVLVDCGINVGSNSPNNTFPRFDLPEFDVEQLDAVVISHAHLDHCLPSDTPVNLSDGTWKTIGNIKPGEKLMSINWETGNYESAICIGKTITTGHRKIVNIKTPYLNIQSSPNHRFFTIRGLKLEEIQADTLEKGDLLPVEKTKFGKSKGIPIKLDRDINYDGRVKINKEIRNLLKECRLKRKLSKTKLAKIINVQLDTISKIETKQEYVTFPILQKLIKYYNISWDDFVSKYDLLRLPKYLTSELAKLIGYIQGDGTKDIKTLSIRIVEPDKAVIDYYIGTIKQLFGIAPHVRERKDTVTTTFYIELNNAYIYRFLEKNFETVFAKSRKITIPKLIETSSDEILASYIGGLYDAEGSVMPSVKLCTFSRALLEKLQVILYRFGIHNALNYKEMTLQINSTGSIVAFSEIIGFTSRNKKILLNKMLTSRHSDSEYKLRDLVPIDSKDLTIILKDVGILGKIHNSPKIADLPPALLDLYRRKSGYMSSYSATQLVSVLKERFEELEDLRTEVEDNFMYVRQQLSIPRTVVASSVGLNTWNVQHREEQHYEDVHSTTIKEFLEEQIGTIQETINDYVNKIEYILSLDVEWQRIVSLNTEKNDEPLIDIEVSPNKNFIANNIIVHNSGFVPYLFKYGYKGAVYATRPTRDLMTMLQIDYLDVATKEGKTLPYEQKDIRQTVIHTIVLDYGEVTDITPDIRLTFHNAGHIVGSAIPHLHIGEGMYNVAFAQDIKYARSNLLDPANNRFPRLETLFIESTYGKPQDILPPRAECEKLLRNIVFDTIKKGGKVLIPVLAVGRAQEILVVLEGLMRNGELPNIPIYTDGMIREASAITTAHPEFLSKNLRERIFHAGNNPFLAEQVKQVSSQEERDLIIDGDPAIIVATSGMLNGGPSVHYFKALCQEPNNALVFVSYQGKGTLGSKIQKGITEIQMIEDGRTVMYHIDMSVHVITGFTGHSDRRELENYVNKVTPKPERIVVIHGDETKVSKFASWVYKNTKRESLAPPNGTTIRLR